MQDTFADLEKFKQFAYAHRYSLRGLGRMGTTAYCSTCGELRRVVVEPRRITYHPPTGPPPAIDEYNDAMANQVLIELAAGGSMFGYTCLQCHADGILVCYPGPRGPGLVVLAASYGGIRTPNTPEGVAYYLDQAHKSQAVGANSAAVAMYRAALEQLLFEQGFQKGMLHDKIQELEKAIAAATASPWARELDTELLDLVKKLGNHSIHATTDIKKQAALDAEVLRALRELFAELLLVIYEIPAKKADRKNAFKAAIATMK